MLAMVDQAQELQVEKPEEVVADTEAAIAAALGPEGSIEAVVKFRQVHTAGAATARAAAIEVGEEVSSPVGLHRARRTPSSSTVNTISNKPTKNSRKLSASLRKFTLKETEKRLWLKEAKRLRRVKSLPPKIARLPA